MDNTSYAPFVPLPLPQLEMIRHTAFGTPSALWRYSDREGRLLFAVARFDTQDGKEVLPYCCTANGWTWKAPPAPRPLYGLQTLALRPDAPVLLVEGEKTADAAAGMFPHYVATTWQGGSSATGKADFSPLAGRVVTIWPDADTPGRKCAAALVPLLHAAGVKSLHVVMVPEIWPNGWDLADRLPPGVEPKDLERLLVAAEVQPSGVSTSADRPSDLGKCIAIVTDPLTWGVPLLDLATAETMPAPPLPLALFPGRWPDWIGKSAERAGAPADYVATSLLAVVGAAIGNARWASPWDGWAHPPVVNVACVGLPSAGKSPALDATTAPLSQLENDLNADFEERMRTWRTERQEAKERLAIWEAEVREATKGQRPPPLEPVGAREPEQPQRRRAYTTTPTMEAARDLSVANPRGMLLHRDELAGWITGMDAYSGKSGAERAFWLQAYEGKPWIADRVKDGADTRHVPHLTWGVVGGIQPDRLGSLVMRGDDDGLSARFIYCWPAPRLDVSQPPTGDALPFDLQERLRRLRQLPMENDAPLTLLFSPEARRVLQEAREEVKRVETHSSGLFLSWVGKLPGMLVRLALVFSYLRWLDSEPNTTEPAGIEFKDAHRAADFLFEYALPMARRAFGEAALPEAERDARRLARWLLNQKPVPERLNARELRRLPDGPGISTSARINAALHELADLRFVHPAPGREGPTPGRQRSDWLVNPALREKQL